MKGAVVMPIFNHPVSLILPIQVGYLKTTFFLNQNMYLVNDECNSVPHNHQYYELFFYETGNSDLIINYKVTPAQNGELVIIHPMEYHFQTNNKNVTRYNVRFSVEQPSTKHTSSDVAYKAFTEFLDGARKFKIPNDSIPLMFRLLKDNMHDLSNGYVCSTRFICSLILVELIRLSKSELREIYPTDELKYHGHVQTQIDTFFREKYLSNIKIQDLANDMNVSVRQVNNILHKTFGMSFTQKLTSMRLELAATQLIYTDAPISKICHDCSFSSQNYFSSHFRKRFGMTPSEFRAHARKNLPF